MEVDRKEGPENQHQGESKRLQLVPWGYQDLIEHSNAWRSLSIQYHRRFRLTGWLLMTQDSALVRAAKLWLFWNEHIEKHADLRYAVEHTSPRTVCK
jgi:hypothetical protein